MHKSLKVTQSAYTDESTSVWFKSKKVLSLSDERDIHKTPIQSHIPRMYSNFIMLNLVHILYSIPLSLKHNLCNPLF